MERILIDTRGKFCPVPILELARAARSAVVGRELEVLATDPAVRADLQAWCEATRNELWSFEELPGPVYRAIVIRR